MIFPEKQNELLLCIGETILGIPAENLGDDFIQEINRYVGLLDDYLIKDLKNLVTMFGSRAMVFMRLFKFKKFVGLSPTDRLRYVKSWGTSRIPLLRTGYTALRSLCGWAYYSNDDHGEELGHLGKTIGREKETPTLLSPQFYPNSPLARGDMK